MTSQTVIQDRVGLGISAMVIGMAMMSSMDAMAKWLGEGYPIGQVVFFRNLFGLLPTLAIVWQLGGFTLPTTRRWRLHLLRGLLGVTAQFSFFLGLRSLGLAEATAIAFAAPLMVTALSVPLLGEKVGPRRWAAVVLGFLGVLIMVRPGPESFQPAALLILLAAFSYAMIMLTTRMLARSDSNAALLLFGSTVSLTLSALLLPIGWKTPDMADFAVFVALGLIGGTGMFFITQAYRYAPAAVVAPFEYVALVVAAVLGFLFWQEIPDLYVWLGAAVVIGAGIYIFYRETRLKAAPRKAAQARSSS
ncbi:MAG: DMT family transporter [Rhodovibrionaceae bacterium]